MSLKSDYEKFRKKHPKTPSWKWLNDNFNIKDEDGFKGSVHIAITGKLMFSKDQIEPLLSNSENYCCWFERKMVSKQDKDDLFELYKVLQYLIWGSGKAKIMEDDKSFALWLVNVRENWDEIRPKIIEFMEKISDGWKNYKVKKESTIYHG